MVIVYEKSYFIENQLKQCNSCEEILPLDKFGIKKRGFLGVKAVCKQCLNEIEKERLKSSEDARDVKKKLTYKWRIENKERWKEAHRLYRSKRKAYKRLLPNEITLKNLEEIKTKEYDQDTFEIDHFIPLSWGHGGTIAENLCVIPKSWNSSKSDMNPFDFMDTLKTNEKTYFIKIIKRIANQHKINIDELRQYVFWCEQNKRSIEQLMVADKSKKSFEIWKEVLDL